MGWLKAHAPRDLDWDALAKSAQGLSCAEIARAANEAIKDALIRDQTRTKETDIAGFINERQVIASRLIRK